MTLVKSGELRLAESLHHREHGSVNESDPRIRVSRCDLTSARVVTANQGLHLKRTRGDVIKQKKKRMHTQSPVHQLIDLHQQRVQE